MVKDYTDHTVKKRINGSISGFSTITPNELPDVDAQIPHINYDYTVEDILLLLKRLVGDISQDALSKIIDLISSHIENMNNPHQTTLESMHTDVLQELYKIWIAEGNSGSEFVFLKVLFQWIVIADLSTALEGITRNEVMSVYTAKKVIEQHDQSLDAHKPIFDSLFPGKRFLTQCTHSLHRTVGMDKGLQVERDSPLWVITPSGYLKMLAAGEYDLDYTFREGYFPIFKSHTNLSTNSGLFDTSTYILNNSTFVIDTDVINVYPINDTVKICETVDTTTSTIHGITSKQKITVQQDLSYTISVYVKPAGRNAFGIGVPSQFISDSAYMHYDLIDEQTYTPTINTPDMMSGGVSRMASGWCRVWMTFKAKTSGDLDISYYILDIHNGDRVYTGSDPAKGCCIYGSQIVQSEQLTPYIPTNNSTQSHNATTLFYEFDDENMEWYNPNSGTFVIGFKTPGTTDVGTGTVKLEEIVSGYASTTNKTPVFSFRRYVDTDVFNFQSYTPTGSPLFIKDLPRIEDRDLSIYTWSYNSERQFIGYVGYDAETTESTVSSALSNSLKYITVGTNAYKNNHLDGYLAFFYYYPEACEHYHVDFFSGEVV